MLCGFLDYLKNETSLLLSVENFSMQREFIPAQVRGLRLMDHRRAVALPGILSGRMVSLTQIG